MNKVKYRFKIIYQTDYLKRACEMMRKLDLGWDNKEVGIEWDVELTRNGPRETPAIKADITLAMEMEGLTVVSITGGQYE
jgi:hypothetical protein